MIDVTAVVRQWICCSNDLWSRWFASRDGGSSDFADIELALLQTMVLNRENIFCEGILVQSFFAKLLVIYPDAVHDQNRQFCVVQSSGNVFCRPRNVTILTGSKFPVRSIDTMGTMTNGTPYVEIEFEKGYLLESPELVNFALELT